MSRDYDEAHDPRQFKVVNGVRSRVQGDALESLMREYRPSMPEPILREWAADIVVALTASQPGNKV